jgi:hypothetical protein
MGTNYYWVPTKEVVKSKYDVLLKRIAELNIEDAGKTADLFASIEDGWDRLSPWDEFTAGLKIHLGKRSSGWKFCWNFNEDKYYHSKDTLLAFIRSGRVVDEYGEEESPEEFIEMALNWDGIVVDAEYVSKKERISIFDDPKYYDRIIDGLRVSSSTDFF